MSPAANLTKKLAAWRSLLPGPYRLKDFGHKFWDGAEATILVEERFDREAWVLGWEPVVSQHRCPNGTLVELIHHMNILAKTEDEVASLFPPGETLHHGSDGAEHIKVLAAYGRGGEGYRLPAGFGLNFGRGLTRLMLEFHTLTPDCWDFSRPALDTSGFDLYLTRSRPRRLAAFVGFTSSDLLLRKSQGWLQFSADLPPEKLASLFSGEYEKDQVEVLSVGLHTHEYGVSKWFEIYDRSGRLTFESPHEPGGYGPLQSPHNIAAKPGWPHALRLSRGDSLRITCRYDSDTFEYDIYGGTSWGEEMCAAFLAVTSSVVEADREPVWAYLSMGKGELKVMGRQLSSSRGSPDVPAVLV